MDNQTQAVMELAKAIYGKDKPEEDLKESIKRDFSMEVDSLDEDQLDDLSLRMIQKKKSGARVGMKVEPWVRPAPRPATPPTPTPEQLTLTDFKDGESVRHLKMSEWGRGSIVSAQPYRMGDEWLQKLDILFASGGRRTLIIRPGMLDRM